MASKKSILTMKPGGDAGLFACAAIVLDKTTAKKTV